MIKGALGQITFYLTTSHIHAVLKIGQKIHSRKHRRQNVKNLVGNKRVQSVPPLQIEIGLMQAPHGHGDIAVISSFTTVFSTLCNKKLCPCIHYDFQDQSQIHHCYHLEFHSPFLVVEDEQIALGILTCSLSKHNLSLNR